MEENLKNETNQKKISGSTLKLIAMGSMLIDHIAAGLLLHGYLPYLIDMYGARSGIYERWVVIYKLMRCIGRMAFPIFCFLLVEGYMHTKNVKKYLVRLFLFGIASEVPFDLAFGKSWLDFDNQNVYWTLFLGLLAIALYDGIQNNKKLGNEFIRRLLSCVCIVACGAVAILATTDYNAVGVFMILLFYFTGNVELLRNLSVAIAMLGAGTVEIAGYIAFIPMHFYNGKRGLNLKYVFYAFYPLHLLLIVLVRYCLFGH